jgi:hypothetical protein
MVPFPANNMGLLDAAHQWEEFRIFQSKGIAEALAARLESDGVPTQMESRRLENALDAHFVVYVTKELAHRARWILAQLPPDEADVYYMATGQLPDKS